MERDRPHQHELVVALAVRERGRPERLGRQQLELPLETGSWATFADRGTTPHQDAETSELMTAIRDAIESELTSHQREILVAITLNDVPIDVLAERLSTTRGALYKTLHDARRKLPRAPRRPGPAPRKGDAMTAHLDPDRLARILGPAEREVSCEECFDLLDQYVELELSGADADRAIPGLRPHLAGCPACREDHDSLLAYTRGER